VVVVMVEVVVVMVLVFLVMTNNFCDEGGCGVGILVAVVVDGSGSLNGLCSW
jgi:hypothetical protein